MRCCLRHGSDGTVASSVDEVAKVAVSYNQYYGNLSQLSLRVVLLGATDGAWRSL